MIYGQNPSKESRPIQTDDSGNLLTKPATTGPQTSANSQSVTPASDARWQVDQKLLSTTGEYFRADGATTISYNADGTIAYIQITDGSSNYRQTWTWTSGNPTSITGWVKQ